MIAFLQRYSVLARLLIILIGVGKIERARDALSQGDRQKILTYPDFR